jgi:hypothetical protein
MKVCSLCKLPKPVEAFRIKMQRGKPYLQARCYDCQRKVWRDKWASKDFALRRHEKKVQHVKSRYGLSEDDYQNLFMAQDGKCAICGFEETEQTQGTVRRLNVDHNHQTGKVRGLLCNRCNSGLGQFDDDVARLKVAVTYLERANNG